MGTPMNILRMLAELRAERDVLDEAINALQRIAYGEKRRRGRPPKWMAEAKADRTPGAGQRRPLSLEARERIAAAQRKRWAAARKVKGKAEN